MKKAIWIRELDWPERWLQAEIVKRNTGSDGVPTITARRGSMLMVRHLSDHGTLWWYFDEKRLEELAGRTDYDAWMVNPEHGGVCTVCNSLDVDERGNCYTCLEESNRASDAADELDEERFRRGFP